MLPYFTSAARIAALESTAQSWPGTPWRLNSCVKGPGGAVSCTHLTAALYVASGFLPPFVLPRDNLRALQLGISKNLRDFFPPEISARFSSLDLSSPLPAPSSPLPSPSSLLLPGDLALFAENGSALHIGVVLAGRRFIHVMSKTGVLISLLDDVSYSDALLEALRPCEL